ncbi:MAG: QueT transporter family protein [Coriobacteriaceae bacterium]|nr:QueT transporter family protein [Coriobacteriaceae bacterium]
MHKRSAAYVAQAGVIAALYAALTLVVLQFPGALGWGLVQFRPSEAVTVVAALTPAAAAGLTLGCAVANAFNLSATPLAWFDVVLGSAATLAGALWTWRFRDRTALALAGPVLFNALVVPAYLPIVLAGAGLYRTPLLGVDLEGAWLPMYLFGVAAIGVSEAVVVYGLGWPLLTAMRHAGVGRMLSV